jgi:Ca-activated chloride channel family protein
MMATDVDPSRLAAAQQAARDFVDQVDPDVEVGLISFSGVVTNEVAPTLDREALDRGIENLELAESTAIGDALVAGTRLLTNLAEDSDSDEQDEDIAPGAIVLLSDGETTVGRETAEGAEAAAAANVPGFTIAFGTADGSITDPVSGETIPVPVQPGPLADVAETTGGAAYEAATATELSDAYDRIQDALGDTLGEEIETVTELTWRWAAAAIALLAAAWALGLWWLRGMV